ncbi:hypothetical protein MKJ01_05645 [Chryseobacterium sp. SSA4.19]|uniref:hypothetical protein n=1 Tax=Chryseobacterium sp. SSA4.19 TaxID=2919915 RepID=UPI001F4EF1FB|nr:hypothetical protein [Chryseobacterium sp. SSA4.19]MCJ8153244.1 hypothetical protein [Chryseobacterium sp. SSA4.19]
MTQYPHDLYVVSNTEGGTDPETGFPIPSEPTEVFHCKCREIAAGPGNIVANESGETVSYASKVVMPKGTAKIPTNSKIIIKDGENIILTGDVIRFSDAPQLHCRLWV